MSTPTILVSRVCAVFAAAAFVGTGAIQGQTTSTQAAAKPNILMIYTDDMGYGDVSCYGDLLDVKTPHIDAFAKESLKFTQFYVAMPICSPSRAAVLSGTFSPESQLTDYLQTRQGNVDSDQNDFMDPKRSYLPKAFKGAGYATGHIGKWHLGGGRDVNNAPSILEYGYDEAYSTWESPNRDPKLGTHFAPWDHKKDPGQVDRWERTEYMVDKTLDFLDRHKGKPCFITLWPDDMHTPYWPSPEMMKKHGGSGKDDRDIKNFYGVLEEYDRQIGRLMDELKKRGLEKDTIVFFSSDNGPSPTYDQKRTAGLRGKKTSLYEGGIREPFIIRWPGHVPAGQVNNDTVMCTVDLLPTLTSLAGIKLSDEAAKITDGEDLSAAILGKDVKRTKTLMWEFGRTPHVPRPKKGLPARSPKLAIREGDFKVLVDHDGKNLEVYNIVKDKNEKTNIADQHSSMSKDMSARVIKWAKTLPHRTQPVPTEKKPN